MRVIEVFFSLLSQDLNAKMSIHRIVLLAQYILIWLWHVPMLCTVTPTSSRSWKRPLNSASLTMFISSLHGFDQCVKKTKKKKTPPSLSSEKQLLLFAQISSSSKRLTPSALFFSSFSRLVLLLSAGVRAFVRAPFEHQRLLPPLWEQWSPVARGVALRLTLQVFALPHLLSVYTLIPQDPPCSPSPLEHVSFHLSWKLTEILWRSEYTLLSLCVSLHLSGDHSMSKKCVHVCLWKCYDNSAC